MKLWNSSWILPGNIRWSSKVGRKHALHTITKTTRHHEPNPHGPPLTSRAAWDFACHSLVMCNFTDEIMNNEDLKRVGIPRVSELKETNSPLLAVHTSLLQCHDIGLLTLLEYSQWGRADHCLLHPQGSHLTVGQVLFFLTKSWNLLPCNLLDIRKF